MALSKQEPSAERWKSEVSKTTNNELACLRHFVATSTIYGAVIIQSFEKIQPRKLEKKRISPQYDFANLLKSLAFMLK